jgi:hypothetical protein
MERKYTPGNWKVGKYGSTVVSDKIPENYIGESGHGDIEYYGGFLIGESISNQDAKLIAAAPDLLEALISIENDDNHIPETIWKMRNNAIKKATE